MMISILMKIKLDYEVNKITQNGALKTATNSYRRFSKKQLCTNERNCQIFIQKKCLLYPF